MTSPRLAAVLGVATPAYFLAAILAFGWMTPGFAHASKAVSELGALGAIYMLQWNIFGFGLTGFLLAAFGAAFPGSGSAKWALFFTGAAFAGTAIPADMIDRASFTTTAHALSSFAAFFAWVWALGSTVSGAPPGFRALAIAFMGLALGAIVFQQSGIVWPGTGQRVTFAVFFAWYFAAGVLLWRTTSSATDSTNS
jgi:hypothetical protein